MTHPATAAITGPAQKPIQNGSEVLAAMSPAV